MLTNSNGILRERLRRWRSRTKPWSGNTTGSGYRLPYLADIVEFMAGKYVSHGATADTPLFDIPFESGKTQSFLSILLFKKRGILEWYLDMYTLEEAVSKRKDIFFLKPPILARIKQTRNGPEPTR